MAEFLDELGYPREVTKHDVVAAFLKTIQRPLNCLSAENQRSRRNALDILFQCLLEDDGAGSLPPMDVLQAAWDDTILEKALRCVSDPTEKCRELAIQLIRGVAKALTEVDCTLKETILVMAERMGQVPVLEDSEEMRLQLLSLLNDVLLPECELLTLQNIIDPLHRIVTVTLNDHFHEVKKSACSVLVTTANRNPNAFGNKTGVLLKALVPCLSHSHSRVRIAVFQAIDAMVRCGLTAPLVAQQLVPGIKSLAFDHSTAVRELFFSSVANWLNYNSRSMTDEEIGECIDAGKVPLFHVPELLPLLLLGITDDSLEIATSTYERLEGVGYIYKKIIDELDKRKIQEKEGDLVKTAEEGASIMERELENDRKRQERYEQELRQIEELRSSQREVHPVNRNSELIGEEVKNENELENNHLVQAPEIVIGDHDMAEDEKSRTPEQCVCMTRIEDSPETADKDTKHAVLTEEKNCNTSELEEEEEGETRTADDDLTSETVYDEDLKEFNAHPGQCSRTSAGHSYNNGNPEMGVAPDRTRSLKSQTDWKEDDLTVEPLSAETILDANLQVFNACENPRVDVADESQSKVERDELLEAGAQQVPENNEEKITAGENNSVNGLYVLTNELTDRDADRRTETVVTLFQKDVQKGTSEITDEGAVRKKDSDEAGVETLQLPKPYEGRPGAGCRLMVEAFLRQMIEPALKELKQWTTPTRLSAARLLHTLLALAEGFAKDNLDILVPAFCSAVGDDDVKVAKRIVATVHIVGFHVPPEKWLPLVLKPLGNTKTSQAQRANLLVVTAAFLYGTRRKEMEEKYVERICDKLYEREVCCSDYPAIQNQLLSVVTNLIQVAGALCKSSSFKIFVLLLQLQSVEGDAQLQKRSGQVLEVLAQTIGMGSARDLYVQHIHNVLDIVTADHEGWSSDTPGKLMFQTFMRNANDTVGPYLESLLPVFRACLEPEQDPALRISFLQLLDELFEKPELDVSWALLAPEVIGKILVPCAVWRRSKTEAAVRYGAMVAIGTFLRRDLCSQAHMQEILKMPEGFLAVLKTCIDEDYFLDVRRATTHVMYQFLRVAGSILTDEERCKLIKVLSKRMDDSSNTIRLAILPAVAMFFVTMPPSFSDSEVTAFTSYIQNNFSYINIIWVYIHKANDHCGVFKRL
ncbi:hypothetical protein M758_3G148000 [Ceratodon purpureus]|nr:hypothetical protein M758_3G148000 [Ceratodon purpureus]